ncbi:membrane-bound lytic murein transglycosylase MltF [Vibrio sp. 99-70-13A1]|uniref:membrane-bound lytic murein transglycosylase MltF n=1 Tax=Vibrio sp. 99-70-13A1 TaxID=2607601 RepID=UPI0014933C0D|nr:membrane-bound lytic murein transglycosylase MltF [Vibrio sp. 99-70-13A1]NOH98040.1 membrane-bound lytic murein transglycosylase MltF [Vibrio sp. 99-70-13A1]
MPKFTSSFFSKLLILTLSTLGLLGCQIESEPKSVLDQIRERGVLRVGTLNNQLSYYIGPDGPAGLDYELAQEFASQLGVKMEIKPAYRLSELFPALKKGEIDIIATGLTQNSNLTKSFRATPAYYYVSQQVVYKKGQWRPRNLKQLIEFENKRQAEHVTEIELNISSNLVEDEISGAEAVDQIEIIQPLSPALVVVKESHFEPTLKELQKEHSDFIYQAVNNADINDLLRNVSKNELLFTVADSVELSLAQRLYPDLALAFELTEDQPISWYLNKSEDESLYALLIEFFGHYKQSGQLASLEEKYIGHIGTFDYVDTRAFIRALDSKLPKWSPLFQKYSQEFDWRMIAALAYQESHWNPVAKSPTGVRGMMMLTLPTAKSVGVTNRLDPKQSVQGGVEYLGRIVRRVPDSITEHEKIWFALASYNVGFGHMMDARRLTKSQGANPDSWADVKERLPLLRQKKYYSQTRYGYARGDEAQNYVENIRRYYQSIIGHVDKQALAEQALEMDDLVVIVPQLPLSSASAAQPANELTNSPNETDK